MANFDRYYDLLTFAGPTGIPPSGSNTITGLIVNVQADSPLQLSVSENYTLSVPVNGVATINADNQWGAIRGLESFAQLFWWNGTASNSYTIDATPVSITDYPRFPWRGLLIDSSRHFLTVSSILSTIDAMAATKLNRLHWHIVDDQSFPLYSSKFPQLAKAGAYCPTCIYTTADVKAITDYAFVRGIAIVPEFDLPAHSQCWGAGLPELIISCPGGQSLIDPTDTNSPSIYDVVDGLLTEFGPLFNTDFIHFGGDEVSDLTCWQQSAEVAAFMQKNNIPTVDALRNYFELRIQNIAKNHSMSSVFWEEVYDIGDQLLDTSIVDVWLGDSKYLTVLNTNRAIESFGLYLDQQIPDGPTHYFWVDTWINFFMHDPLYNQTVSPTQLANALGFSISQWGEQVNPSVINERIWPRAAGGAFRAWSDPSLRDSDAMAGNIDHFSCKLNQRGIGSSPIRPASVYGYCPLPADSRFNTMHIQPFMGRHKKMMEEAN
jgi:hexosaminidase